MEEQGGRNLYVHYVCRCVCVFGLHWQQQPVRENEVKKDWCGRNEKKDLIDVCVCVIPGSPFGGGGAFLRLGGCGG